MINFTRQVELDIGTNVDSLVKAQDARVASVAKSFIGYDPWERRKQYTNSAGKKSIYLDFVDDDDAIRYFKYCQWLKADYVPINFQFLLSFGSADGVFGFDKILQLANALNSTYVDSQKLPALGGSYLIPPESGKLSHPRNIFWMEYYKGAMEKTPKMCFVITKAWTKSKNCWQEMGWAYDIRTQDDHKNIIVFQDQDTAEKLESGEPLGDLFDGYREYCVANFKNTEERHRRLNFTWRTYTERINVHSYIRKSTFEGIKRSLEEVMVLHETELPINDWTWCLVNN
mmetsp:Transcript_31454/g.47774  ORF Transcript_31454/g.47774 Transcript_31454/m.47774 type:complete len:286 (+) Transcript_31454:7441-8298(+)